MFIFTSSVSFPTAFKTQPSQYQPSSQKSGVIPGEGHLASDSDMVRSPRPAVFHSFIWRRLTGWFLWFLIQPGDTKVAIWLERKLMFLSKLATTVTSQGSLPPPSQLHSVNYRKEKTKLREQSLWVPQNLLLQVLVAKMNEVSLLMFLALPKDFLSWSSLPTLYRPPAFCLSHSPGSI